MGENTNIAWTDATWNAWWGCTEISPACTNCYARLLSARVGKAGWGVGKPRIRTSPQVWNAPYRWNKIAEKAGIPTKVFCSSMSDFFDNAVDPSWRTEAWQIIRETRWLRWQILTKRIGNVEKMLPEDWGNGFNYPHVGFMATIANQEEANRDIPKLLHLKWSYGATWVGLSCEPLLGPIDLTCIEFMDEDAQIRYDVTTGETWVLNSDSASAYDTDHPRLDWVIVGGESGRGSKIRAFKLSVARCIVGQCLDAAVPVFVKQLGSWPVDDSGRRVFLKHWKGEDPAQWPVDLRHQQFPEVFK